MGCDGGTIPKRKEIVKNKDKASRSERKKEADEAEKWKSCALSDWVLRKPIVASPYGYLMSKEEILMHLIEKRRDALSSYHRIEDKPDLLSPIHSTKDFKELKLKENPNAKNNEASTSNGDGSTVPEFVCPITGLETNGKYKFYFSWVCGCVVSERAVKEVPNEKKCLVCQKPYEKWDLVIINPSAKELVENQAKFLVRKMAPHLKDDESESNDSSPNKSQTSSTSSKEYSNGPSTSRGTGATTSSHQVRQHKSSRRGNTSCISASNSRGLKRPHS